MQKSAPSFARIGAMVVFALSCFGLLLFLWLSFGGPIPLKPKGYRFQVAFPEAATLGLEADVRVAGVSVGKVRKKQLDDGNNRTLVTIEVDRRFAPVSAGAKAILRQKTLLGETYVELTPGTGGEKVPENGRLQDGRVQPAVELDEIFQALDPETRSAFRRWQQDLAKGISGRGRDFNDALGTLPGFAADGSDLLEVLDTHDRALSRLVKNTGVVFGALSENEDQLRNLITSSDRMFQATASQSEALAESIRIFPTFLDESKSTLARLQGFSRTARPLMEDLQPVARELGPTVRDVRALSPDLERTFRDIGPLITASRTGLPALTQILQGLRPALGELGPFLSQINPILEYLEISQFQVSDFISNGGAALYDTTVSSTGGMGHYLRQINPNGAESLGIYRQRLSTNRGNAYWMPMDAYPSAKGAKFLASPQFDCNHVGGEQPTAHPEGSAPACWTNPNIMFQNRLQPRFPRVEAADYSQGK